MMPEQDPDTHARGLAAESLAAGDPTSWFDRLYDQAEQGAANVPWDREAPQQFLVEWANTRAVDGSGLRAVVVGCGPGRDAEYVAELGFDTVAFDVSDTAIRVARRRHPHSTVRYRTADLLDPPAEWSRSFDFVMESLTVQALPEPPRHEAIARVRDLLRPGGTLLVVANARDEDTDVEGPPWPLTPSEIDSFAADGLTEVRRERIPRTDDPTIHVWRVEFRRRQDDSDS